MSEQQPQRPVRQFPTSPKPDAIKACDACPLAEDGRETYFAPYEVFHMDFSQFGKAKDEQVGIPTLNVCRYVRRDIDLYDRNTGGNFTQHDAIVPTVCDETNHMDLPPESWAEITAAGCEQPVVGPKKYKLFGERALTCGLIAQMRGHAVVLVPSTYDAPGSTTPEN